MRPRSWLRLPGVSKVGVSTERQRRRRVRDMLRIYPSRSNKPVRTRHILPRMLLKAHRVSLLSDEGAWAVEQRRRNADDDIDDDEKKTVGRGEGEEEKAHEAHL